MQPTKPTTPEQLTVIVWSTILFFIALGAVGMAYALRAPAAKAVQANQLIGYSLVSWALAAIVYGGKRVVAWWFE